jgi:ribosomal protein S2
MRSIKLFASRIADICLEGQEMSRVSQEKENAKQEEAKKAEAKKAEAKESVKEEPAPDDLPESAPVASDNGNS